MTQDSKKEKFAQICTNCNGRNHMIIHEQKVNSEDEEGLIWQLDRYQIVQCEGCDRISYRTVSLNSEDYYVDEDGYDYILTIKRYPEPIKWSFPEWAVDIDAKGIFQLLGETYSALENNLFTLAAMGIRTIIDLFYLDKLGADLGGFESKLKQMEKSGVIDSNEKTLLGFLVNIGNAASHRGFFPDEKMTKAAIEIMEHLLLKHYIYPGKAAELVEKATLLKNKVPEKTRTNNPT